MKQLLSFLFGQVISNLVLLSIAGVLFLRGCPRLVIYRSRTIWSSYSHYQRLCCCVPSSWEFSVCLVFVFLNVVRDFQIFNSVKSL